MTYAIVNKFRRPSHHQFPVTHLLNIQISTLAANTHFIAIGVLPKHFRCNGASPRPAAKGLPHSALPDAYSGMIFALHLNPHQANPFGK